MDYTFQLGFGVIFGIVCLLMAQARGRSAVGWAIGGFFFGCLAFILLLVLPDLKALEARENRLRQQNRRLREKQRGDRRTADERYNEQNKRLRAHDIALDMDTQPPALAKPEQETVSQLTSHPSHIESEGTEWFYATDGKQEGPITFGAMKSLWQANHINADTLLWSQGMNDWAPVDDIPDLRGRLDA